MRVLLDTRALLWFCGGNDALSLNARAAIEDASNDRYVSHATVWEIAIKLSLGKLKLQVPFDELFPGVVAANGLQILIPDIRHYRELLTLPFYHRDPFDRLLLAQAKVENLAFVTRDPSFAAYGVPLVW